VSAEIVALAGVVTLAFARADVAAPRTIAATDRNAKHDFFIKNNL
jgi:hypothetical protein